MDRQAARRPPADRALEVRTLWGSTVLDVRAFAPGRDRLTVGGGEGRADVDLPGQRLPAAPFELLKRVDGRLELCLPPGVGGELELADGRRTDARSAAAPDPGRPGCLCLELPAGAGARLRFGPLGLGLSWAARPAGVVSGRLATIDAPYLNALLLALFLCAALIATIQLRPADPKAAEQELGRVPDRYVQLLLQREQPRPRLVLAESLSLAGPDEPRGEPEQRLRGSEGAAGLRERLQTGRQRAVRGQSQDPAEAVRGRGLLAVLGQAPGALPGDGRPEVGRDLMSAIGAISGREPGESGGAGGAGRIGQGPGGGADGRTLGAGRLVTHGRAGGQPDYGVVRSRPRRRGERQVVIDTGVLQVVGPLSMALIRSVIDAHRDQIRYCYNQALTRDPGLSGKLVVRFTIAANGYVSAARSAGGSLQRAELERCILERVGTWKFPPPRGGGAVIVNYPFLFRSPGR